MREGGCEALHVAARHFFIEATEAIDKPGDVFYLPCYAILCGCFDKVFDGIRYCLSRFGNIGFSLLLELNALFSNLGRLFTPAVGCW